MFTYARLLSDKYKFGPGMFAYRFRCDEGILRRRMRCSRGSQIGVSLKAALLFANLRGNLRLIKLTQITSANCPALFRIFVTFQGNYNWIPSRHKSCYLQWLLQVTWKYKCTEEFILCGHERQWITNVSFQFLLLTTEWSSTIYLADRLFHWWHCNPQ